MVVLFRAACAVLIALFLGVVCGCQFAGKADPRLSQNVTFVLNGLDGPGPWYSGLVGGLQHGDNGEQVELVAWGAPLTVLPNLFLSSLHNSAETRLARRIRAWREAHPLGRISLLGHSAGCGVVLGALPRLPQGMQVDNVLLLAPAVSENRDLAPALMHVAGTLHVFYSTWDEILPSTLLTGTYDGAPGNSAGRGGFDSARNLEPELLARLQQHAHRQEWVRLGCTGGHFGWRARPFVEEVLAPLAAANATAVRLHLPPVAGLAPAEQSAAGPAARIPAGARSPM